MRPILQGLPKRALMALVRGYQLVLSPWLQTGCRYEPTCSGYAMQALDRHGATAGTYLAVARVLRCHPFCDGGLDAVPEHPPRLFRRFVTGASNGAGTVTSPSIDNQTSP